MSESNRRVRFDEAEIDAIFHDLDQSSLPGAAVGIALGGVPLYRKGFGLASMDLPVMFSTHTHVRTYSTTKHFTCLAYLLFCEEGKAGIDDPIEKYLPDLHPVTHRVTMRQLMSHTSGLRDACEIRWFFSGIESTVPASELLAQYRNIQDVDFNPGHGWGYNNGAYHILSAVIEKLADQPLEEVFRKRIFEPVGMHDTLLKRVDTDFIPNSAAMHMTAAGGGYEKKYLAGEIRGEGGIVSTVDDMLRWLKHMARPTVGTSETWALMCTSHKLHNGAETGYGLGLHRCAYLGLDTISHGGGGLGMNSQMIRIPEAGLDVFAVANRHDVSAAELVGRILNVCLDIRRDAPRARTGCATGLFRSPTTGRVIRLFGKEGMQMALIDGAECRMVLSEDNTLQQEVWVPWKSSLRLLGDVARPDGIRYEFFGRSDDLWPVPQTESRALDAVAGEYVSDAIGVRLSIMATGEARYVRTVGRFGSKTYRAEEIGVGLWRLRSVDTTPWVGVLAGTSVGASVSIVTGGMREVSFRRLGDLS